MRRNGIANTAIQSRVNAMTTSLREYICAQFADQVGIEPDVLFGEDLTLSAIVQRSTKLRNSVDLMEAFARTSNALRKERGVRVRLPTLPLNTNISAVLDIFLEEVKAAEARAAAPAGE
jgi:hypothetical protein